LLPAPPVRIAPVTPRAVGYRHILPAEYLLSVLEAGGLPMAHISAVSVH